jgi:hypothetical protein
MTLQPWESPQPGDELTVTFEPRYRQLVGVHGSYVWYAHTDRNGVRREVKCSRATWRKVASAEVAKGGSYVRAGGEGL